MRNTRKSSLFLIILLAITLIAPAFPMAWAMTEFVDDYENENYVAIKENMIRNSTLNCMELNYTTGIVVLYSPFQIREHDYHPTYNPNVIYTKQPTYIDAYSGTTSLGYSYMFFTANREWLNDKYLQWRWYHGGYSAAYTKVYDGEYDRSSMVDFPNNAPILLKGNGVLQTLDSVQGTTKTSDIQFDTSGGSEDTVTVFFMYFDAWVAQSLRMYLFWFKINEGSGGTGNIMGWDMVTAGTTLTMEQTGTYNDYGRIDGGDIEDYVSGGYEPEGYFYTTEVLNGISGSSLTLLTNSTLNDGEITVQFSSDNSTWVDHNNQAGYDSLIEGYESLDLRDLNFTTLYMRYNFTRGGAELTPRLYQIRVITIPDEVIDDYENEDYVAVKDDTIRNSTLDCMELNYSTAIIRIKEYSNDTAVSAFQYREHRIWGATGFTFGAQGFTANDFREYVTPTIYRMAGWFFITVNREWLDGKYVRFRWYKWGIGFSGGSAYTFPRFRMYDGEYDRSSITDFPVSSQPLTKGSGGLMLEAWQIGNVNNWYIREFLIDTSSGDQEYVTLMWADYNYLTTSNIGIIVDYIQINNASGGSQNLWTSDFESANHNLYLEISGTWDDYGLFNGTEGFSSGGYEEDGYFYTTEILDAVNGTSLDLLTNATLNDGEIMVQFSSDNSTWVDHNNETTTILVSGYYGSDFLTGGTATADSEWSATYAPWKAFNDNTGDRWSSTNTAFPHWIKYDLGVGVSDTANKLRIKPFASAGPLMQFKDFKLEGSNNDSDWNELLDETSPNIDAWQEWTFQNSVAYRYYRIWITSSYYGGGNQVSIWEIELMNYTVPTYYGYDDIGNGFESIDLRDLNFTTIYMRYNFTRGSQILLTPRLYQLRLLVSGYEVAEFERDPLAGSVGIFLIVLIILTPVIFYARKKR